MTNNPALFVFALRVRESGGKRGIRGARIGECGAAPVCPEGAGAVIDFKEQEQAAVPEAVYRRFL